MYLNIQVIFYVLLCMCVFEFYYLKKTNFVFPPFERGEKKLMEEGEEKKN